MAFIYTMYNFELFWNYWLIITWCITTPYTILIFYNCIFDHCMWVFIIYTISSLGFIWLELFVIKYKLIGSLIVGWWITPHISLLNFTFKLNNLNLFCLSLFWVSGSLDHYVISNRVRLELKFNKIWILFQLLFWIIQFYTFNI